MAHMHNIGKLHLMLSFAAFTGANVILSLSPSFHLAACLKYSCNALPTKTKAATGTW
jgi:hypothetical protein